jgi:DNA-binding GntR family transcriptional regulator
MSGTSPRTSHAVERAYKKIREQIISGAFPAGHRLVEDELAELTGVSRTPVREALNRLRAEGLIENAARRGARVTGWTDAELDEIYELRALLEGHGAKLAARKIGPEALATLERLCGTMERIYAHQGSAAIDHIAELNNEFHAAIFEAAGNTRLIASLAGIVEVPFVHRAMARYAETHLQRSFSDHRELLVALRAGDPDLAEALMRGHILSARTALAVVGA